MRAIGFMEFGGPEVLRVIDKPDPTPKEGEVVVAVAASTINPTDLLTLSGVRAPMMKDLTPPYIAGMDFSGHVVSVGAGVSSLTPGQPVIGVVSPRRPEGGAHAAQVCVPAASVAPVNPNTDLVAAATVPMNALTALLSFELLGLQTGQTVLITGAAGMLGSLATEIGMLDGFDVLASAGEKDWAFLRSLGIEKILPRDGGGLVEAVRAVRPEGVDGIIDGALIGREVAHLVRDGGGIVSPRASYQIDDARLNISYVQVTKGIEDGEKMLRIGRLLDESKLTPRVAADGVFPIGEAGDAYRMAGNGGVRGRVVIKFAI
jgi:NADPH:quinone reductase-like Zn-dependent oxidoreductase